MGRSVCGKGVKFFVALSIALMLVALFFGLWPRGFDFSNEVTWLPSQPGLRFKEYGVAYTAPVKEWGNEADAEASDFSVEIALRPRSYHDNGFNFILVVHNGDDRAQLVVGQWRSWLIVMNGDDYDHRRKTKRIAIKFTISPSRYRFVTITTGRKGTRIYLDNRLIRIEKDLMLTIPKGQKTRLFLGNAPDGRQSWRGDILGLAWYDHVLGDQDVAMHFRQWSRSQNFLFARKYKPFLLYVFDEKNGRKVIDQSSGNHDLKIPSKMVLLDKKILSLRRVRSDVDSGFVEDVFLNFIGFIPLGFVFMMTFVTAAGFFRKRHIWMTISLCFGISLTIEILQAWIPSRSSDCLDLLLNTFGALLGTMMYVWGYGRVRREKAGKPGS
ncbi:MAG: hypothetical protein DRG82_17275, partial [Deltaproteobacteria bacterium]